MAISTDSVAQSYRKLIDIRTAISSVVLGQDELISGLLIAAMTNNHALIEGLPGLAKSLAVSTFADTIDSSFTRIQFTPDLLPADLTGTQIFDPRDTQFHTRKGPIFSNVILADEINRAPAKVHSALLEAMEETSVTIGGNTLELPNPFLVLATQNPIEQEGTYTLPEAQVDRFMMKLKVDYPSKDEERHILRSSARTEPVKFKKSKIKATAITKAQKSINDIYVDEKVEEYILNLVFSTRNPEDYNLGDLSQLIENGASPRASISLILASKARAFLEGRGYITPEDVRFIGKDVLRHRIILSYEAEAEEISSEDIIQRMFDSIEIP